jgi:hypothetical protein
MSDGGVPNLTSLKIENPKLRDVAAFIGEVARPFAIIITAGCAGWSSITLALKVNSTEAAVFIGAVYLGVGSLYIGKAWEKVTQIKQGGS